MTGTTWRRDPRVLWRRTGHRVVLVAPGREDQIMLDGTGSVTWQLLEEPTAQQELSVLLAEAFDVDLATVDAEVGPFLQELEALEVVLRS